MRYTRRMALITYSCTDGVADITLANPPANAISEPMIGALLEALEQARCDDSAQAVIIQSAVPKRFCAGLDLGALHPVTAEKSAALVEKLYVQLHDAQLRLGKPSIAAVNGAARGGGMTLAISCDMLVAGRNSASFGYPEIDLGLLPAIHFAHLPRIVGKHRAFDLLFTGRSFDAAEACDLGLVSRVVDDEQVLPTCRSIAKLLGSKPPHALHHGRTAFHNASDNGYRQGVRNAVDVFTRVASHPEGRDGVAAFVTRRSRAP